MRGFGPFGLLAILVIVVIPTPGLKSILVLLWAWRSYTPWREIGYVRPRSWILSAGVGFAFGVAFKLLMKAIVMPLLGAAPINSAYHFLVGNTAALPAMIFAVTVGAGFGEETFFRGYLFERLGKLFGSSVSAKTLIVVLTSVLFALAHLREQGFAGVEQALITGLVFGTIFAVKRRIFVVMCAHAASIYSLSPSSTGTSNPRLHISSSSNRAAGRRLHQNACQSAPNKSASVQVIGQST